MNAQVILALVVMVVCFGIAIFKGLLVMLRNSSREKKCTAKTNATVSELKMVVQRKKTFNRPTFCYEVDGVKYEKKGGLEYPGTHKIGQTEHILYDPEKPQHFIPARGMPSNSAAVLVGFGLAGVAALVYGIIGLFQG